MLQPDFSRFALFQKWPFTSAEFLQWAPRARAECSKLSASHVSARLNRAASAEVVAELRHLNAQVSTKRHPGSFTVVGLQGYTAGRTRHGWPVRCPGDDAAQADPLVSLLVPP